MTPKSGNRFTDKIMRIQKGYLVLTLTCFTTTDGNTSR